MATSNRAFLVLFLLFAAINLIDFLFYGQNLRNLFGATGFGLMAYGWHKHFRSVSIVGAALALSAILVKYLA